MDILGSLQHVGFAPLLGTALQFRRLILGIGLLVALALLFRSVSSVLPLVVMVVLLVALVPESVPYLLAVGRAVVALFAFLLVGLT